ncbi:MAG: SMP-30/gluconolactonase/LRE family protein [Novosphingobium sp.]|nr:SMP-30/gluconolactonase/LRE family protein [Novosphingobium sp.]MCP5402999.1 SMP-30/gluconolactonase/LRE family protein [Novosphingobium sp.]
MEVIAEGLAFPEGPVVMADGSVIVVEVMGGRITRCWNGRNETICEIGGGPNGLAIGPDGGLWVCNNGGLGASGAGTEGRIERVDLSTGKFERVYDSCDGIALEAPNDLVFDSSGRLWFTDLGTIHDSGKAYGGFYSCLPDGSEITAIKRNALSYNGVGLSPDEKHLYVADTFQARVYRYDARLEEQEPQYVATAMGDVAFDSLAVTASGNICVATVLGGGVSTVTPDGKVTMLDVPQDSLVTNIAFGGEDMRDAYLTFSGPGQLVHMRWEEPGLKLAFNA